MKFKPLMPPVIVNGVTISAERIAAEAQNHPAPKGKPGLAWKLAARALAMREVLLQEADARDITPAPVEVSDGLWETEDDSRIRLLLENAVEPAPADESRLRATYDAHPERFRGPSLYEAAHILIPAAPEDQAAREAAHSQAQLLCDRLAEDPGGFTRLAREHSACSSKENGGMLGQLASGDTVPEFEAALADMDEGSITPEPVATRYGFHIIRLDARARGNVLEFQTVLPRLREAEEKAAWVRATKAFIASLVERAEVTGISMIDQVTTAQPKPAAAQTC